jgi:hypothetical protein
MVDHVGAIEPRQLAYASAVLTSLPDPLKALAYQPFGAQAVVLALLVDRDSEALRAAQLERLGACVEPALCEEVEGILPLVQSLAPERRLPLVSMAVPALRRLSRDQLEAFAAGVRELVRADNQVSLYEYALQRLLSRHLAGRRGTGSPSGKPSRSAELLAGPVRHVLGVLAHVGSARPLDAERAFGSGIRALGQPEADASLPPRDLDLRKLDRALDELGDATPSLKRRILAACAACIGTDGQVTLEEGELLRAIADSLGCPVPPLPSLAGADPDGGDPPAR